MTQKNMRKAKKIISLADTKFITMGLFDFLFGKKKTASEPKETVKQPKNSGLPTFEEVSKKKDNSDDNFADYLHQPSTRSESEVAGLDTDQKLIAYTIFPKLKGLDFKKINLDIEQNFQKQVCNDVDGDWYFIQTHMIFLAKAFSKETFEKSLKLLLENNNIKYDEYTVENEIKKWKGKGFVVEIPPKLNGVNVIFITNESLIHTSQTDLSKSNLSEEIQLPEECNINGISHLYDGNDLMKKSKDPLNDLFNVPMLQQDQKDDQYYILIINPNLKPVKLIIDSIVDKNGGKEKFKFNEEINDSWLHTYSSDNFTIGYLERYKTIRINFKIQEEAKKYFPNGQLECVGKIILGKREGFWKFYFEDGQLDQELNFKNGLLDGYCKWYHENGQLKLEVNYKDDKQEGVFKAYHENGQLHVDTFYIDGKQAKSFKQYYENGQLQLESTRKGGVEGRYEGLPDDGFTKTYYENGQLGRQTNYKNGEEISSQCFNENGEETVCK